MTYYKEPPVAKGEVRGPTVSPWRLSEREARIMDLTIEHGHHKLVAEELGTKHKNVENAMALIYKRMSVPGNRVVACVLWSRWRTNNPAEGDDEL